MKSIFAFKLICEGFFFPSPHIGENVVFFFGVWGRSGAKLEVNFYLLLFVL